MDSYCLLCGNSIRKQSSLLDMFYVNDCLCEKCRNKLKKKRRSFSLNGLKIEGLYVYDETMKDLIVQYKEMNDEALAPIFLYQEVAYFKKKYHDYILVPVPSSQKDMERRGFKHVNKMFEILGLPIVDLFEKDQNLSQRGLNYLNRQVIKDHIILKKEVSNELKILLIDDVLTTGASLKACYEKLRGNENVSCFVICYNKIYLHSKNKSIE